SVVLDEHPGHAVPGQSHAPRCHRANPLSPAHCGSGLRREPALRLETRRIPRSGGAYGVDGQTRLESDAIVAALLAGDVPVRGAAAGSLLPVLSLAPSAAAVGDVDLSETQGPSSTARTPVEGCEIKSRNTEKVTPSDDDRVKRDR